MRSVALKIYTSLLFFYFRLTAYPAAGSKSLVNTRNIALIALLLLFPFPLLPAHCRLNHFSGNYGPTGSTQKEVAQYSKQNNQEERPQAPPESSGAKAIKEGQGKNTNHKYNSYNSL